MTSKLTHRLALLAAASTLFVCGLASAQSTGGPSDGEGTPPGANVPPEKAAIDACVGKKEGDRLYCIANGDDVFPHAPEHMSEHDRIAPPHRCTAAR